MNGSPAIIKNIIFSLKLKRRPWITVICCSAMGMRFPEKRFPPHGWLTWSILKFYGVSIRFVFPLLSCWDRLLLFQARKLSLTLANFFWFIHLVLQPTESFEFLGGYILLWFQLVTKVVLVITGLLCLLINGGECEILPLCCLVLSFPEKPTVWI